MAIEIRKLQQEDIAQALVICDEVREYHRDVLDGYFKSIDENYEVEALNSLLSREKSCTLVAVEGDKVLGLLMAEIKSAPYLEKSSRCSIEFLGVKKECRRNGIGRKLMNKILEICDNMKIEEVVLTVFNKNESASEFYQSYGFGPIKQTMNLIL